MIIGAMVLIATLFGGSLIDTFFVVELEKGVKEYVVDEEREKEVTAHIKAIKKSIKSFNKGRKKQLKGYKKINASRATTNEILDEFFLQLTTERAEFQASIIDARLDIAADIRANEWAQIVALSEESIDIREKKAEKKADKQSNKARGKANASKQDVTFRKTRESLDNIQLDSPTHKTLVATLDNLVIALHQLEQEIRAVNLNDNKTVRRHDASREDLEGIAKDINVLRSRGFNALKNFHFVVKDHTNEAQWNEVMKAFGKELEMAVR